uniref:6-cysteine protein n=1 Tax=Parastrongyloides trichosuri TaxID=131310 RepID=A0A0N4ZGN7_PARTI
MTLLKTTSHFSTIVMIWNLSGVLTEILLLGLLFNYTTSSQDKKIPLKLIVKPKGGKQVKSSVTISDIKDSEENVFTNLIIKNKSYGNVTIVRVDMKECLNSKGVDVYVEKVTNNYPDYYLTNYKGDVNLDSQQIKNKKFECDETTCDNGVVIISKEKITKAENLGTGNNAFLLLFTMKELYTLSKIKTIDKFNKLVRCPHKIKWMKADYTLEYKYIESFMDSKSMPDNAKHFLVPAQKTSYSKNIMECGSLYFKGKKVLSIGYNIEYENKEYNKAIIELTTFPAPDCARASPNPSPLVHNKYGIFKYIPIESSFDDVQRIFYSNYREHLFGSVLLLYKYDNVPAVDTKQKEDLEPTCTVIFKEFNVMFNVDLKEKPPLTKPFNINGIERKISVHEIDIASGATTIFVGIGKIECDIIMPKSAYLERNLRTFFKYKYKPFIRRKKYDGSKVTPLVGYKDTRNLKEPSSRMDFSIYGLYQCITIDNTNKDSWPKYAKDPFNYFAILPMNNSVIKEDEIKVNYIHELKGKGKCVVDKDGFGTLKLVVIHINNVKKNYTISDIANLQTSEVKYNSNKSEVIYSGEYENNFLMTCEYETLFSLNFSLEREYKFHASSDKYNVDKEQRIQKPPDNTPVIIASVVAVGFIAIAVVVAFVLLRRRQKKRKRRRLSGKGGIGTTSTKTGTSTSATDVGKSPKDKKKKMFNVQASTSQSEDSTDVGDRDNLRNLIGTKEVVRLTAK